MLLPFTETASKTLKLVSVNFLHVMLLPQKGCNPPCPKTQHKQNQEATEGWYTAGANAYYQISINGVFLTVVGTDQQHADQLNLYPPYICTNKCTYPKGTECITLWRLPKQS